MYEKLFTALKVCHNNCQFLLFLRFSKASFFDISMHNHGRTGSNKGWMKLWNFIFGHFLLNSFNPRSWCWVFWDKKSRRLMQILRFFLIKLLRGLHRRALTCWKLRLKDNIVSKNLKLRRFQNLRIIWSVTTIICSYFNFHENKIDRTWIHKLDQKLKSRHDKREDFYITNKFPPSNKWNLFDEKFHLQFLFSLQTITE